jgi:hypothetical protein
VDFLLREWLTARFPTSRRDGMELPVVDPIATILEIAAVMTRARSPLVTVAGKNQPLLGALTLDMMLDRMLGA